MRLVATVGARKLVIGLEENGAVRRISLDGQDVTVDWQRVGTSPLEPAADRAAHYSLLLGNRSYDLYVRTVPQTEEGAQVYEVSLGGQTYVIGVQDERAQTLASLAGGGHVSGDAAIRAPMPGLVGNVVAPEGTAVARGQPVIVLEAMKMENDLASPRAGIVKSVRVSKGQTVNQNDVLAIIGDPAGSPAPSGDEEA